MANLAATKQTEKLTTDESKNSSASKDPKAEIVDSICWAIVFIVAIVCYTIYNLYAN